MNHPDQPTSAHRGPLAAAADAARWVTRLCVETVFPTTCPGCGAAIPSGPDPLWCDPCGRQILAAAGQEYCAFCGRNTGPYERRNGRCGECRDRHPPWSGLVRVGAHRDLIRRMVLDFKFRHAPFDRMLGRLIVSAVQGAPWRRELDAVVPVPLHWRRRLERGHHPTRVLAKIVGSDLRLPVVEVLRRTRHDRPQVGLSRAQRLENVRGAFAVVRGARLKDVTVCVIDDVTTTGATLAEAARTLRKAGVTAVYTAVIAKSESTTVA